MKDFRHSQGICTREEKKVRSHEENKHITKQVGTWLRSYAATVTLALERKTFNALGEMSNYTTQCVKNELTNMLWEMENVTCKVGR